MMKKVLLSSVILVLILTLLIGCGGNAPAPTTPAATTTAATSAPPATTSAPPAKVYTLQYTTSETPAITTQAESATLMMDKIEKLTNGRVKFQKNYGGSLASAVQEVEAIRSGIADLGRPIYFTENALFNIMALGTLPMSMKDAWSVHQSVSMITKKYAQAELKGLHLFATTGTDPYVVMLKSKKPMTVAEFAGIKIRNPGGYGGQALEKLGMVPVSLVLADVYDAISKGTIEAAYAGRNTSVDYKFYEVCKEMLGLDIGIYTTIMLIMNDNTWNSLPPDIQGVFTDVMTEWAKLNYTVQASRGAPAEKTLKDKGVDVYYLPATEMAKVNSIVLPVWDKAVQDLNDKKLDGKAIMTDFVNDLKARGENPPWKP